MIDYKTNIDLIIKLLKALGFKLKDGATHVYLKKYKDHENYLIEIDFDKEFINYGTKIKCGDKTTSNFKANENFVVLECVNRLLDFGYGPKDIVLEKIYPSGHGTSGKLDILISKNNQAFLMIECKTWGTEFEKELNKIQRNGGQLFTYFQQDRVTEYLTLYTSTFDLKNNEIIYKNCIIKVEPHYRETSNVDDLFDRWNKLFKDNGIFEDGNTPYNIKSKALTLSKLKRIKEDDSSFIFNRFLEILRRNVVSDKPNAFNKIFTLFLCKIVDEGKDEKEELEFQWLDTDTHISFQKRLTDLYKRGMLELLGKDITDTSDEEFDNKFKNKIDDKIKDQIKNILTELRLKKNNEFAIKEVFDDNSFEENAKVVKEVVELLQDFKIRYNEKQQYLGDFFELLLTTGLKQEAGQFFTPVPIARFTINSIPLKELTENKIKEGKANDILPYLIDYACGSGHFLTESMDVLQNIVNGIDESDLPQSIKRQIKSWKENQFEWVFNYIYGIEKDYRLVKTAKVSCYLHGDGLAKVIHGDGIGNFEHEKGYKEKLKHVSRDDNQDNKQFDIAVSNPPYSVSAFKNTLSKVDKSFKLFWKLTDQSSEIECLFIERTKQLLKDGGYAGIILPSSILSNTGIYENAREIILKYFRIVAIAEFGSNTFMATGTNTLTLFLERRNNYEWESIQSIVESFFGNFKDVACNDIDKPFSKYVNHVFNDITLDEYVSLLKKTPTKKIKEHELFKDYQKQFSKLKDDELLNRIIEIEKEKILYFMLIFPQNILLVKTISTESKDKNKDEKDFLGYEFSNRRGSEGIKLYKDKEGNFLSKLYDPINNLNPEKANYYIYNQFLGKTNLRIPNELSNNIGYVNLIDLMNFERVEFTKSISTNLVKKKLKITSKWDLVKFSSIATLEYGASLPEQKRIKGKFPVMGSNGIVGYHNEFIVKSPSIIIGRKGSAGKITLIEEDTFPIDTTFFVKFNREKVNYKYLYHILLHIKLEDMAKGIGVPGLNRNDVHSLYLPLPPTNIQEKIISEIQELEKKEEHSNKKIIELSDKIKKIYDRVKEKYSLEKLSKHIDIISGGTPNTNNPRFWNGSIPWLSVADFNSSNRFVATSQKFITEEGLQNSNARYINERDIIISARATVGAIAQLSKPMTFNQSCYGLRGKGDLSNDFLYYCLKYEIRQFKDNAYGAIFDAITIKTFDSILIPLPSSQEQKKTVSEIEKIETEIQKLEKSIEDWKLETKIILEKYL